MVQGSNRRQCHRAEDRGKDRDRPLRSSDDHYAEAECDRTRRKDAHEHSVTAQLVEGPPHIGHGTCRSRPKSKIQLKSRRDSVAARSRVASSAHCAGTGQSVTSFLTLVGDGAGNAMFFKKCLRIVKRPPGSPEYGPSICFIHDRTPVAASPVRLAVPSCPSNGSASPA
jgi:hypothetical protein